MWRSWFVFKESLSKTASKAWLLLQLVGWNMSHAPFPLPVCLWYSDKLNPPSQYLHLHLQLPTCLSPLVCLFPYRWVFNWLLSGEWLTLYFHNYSFLKLTWNETKRHHVSVASYIIFLVLFLFKLLVKGLRSTLAIFSKVFSQLITFAQKRIHLHWKYNVKIASIYPH